MSGETRDALLYSQLQEGLKDELMKASAVSNASTYKELRIAAKNEEKRLSSLKRCEQYHREGTDTSLQDTPVGLGPLTQPTRGVRSSPSSSGTASRRCYLCNKEGHVARDLRTESMRPAHQPSKNHGQGQRTDVRQVRVEDSGSHSHCVKVNIQGVPVRGIIDSGSDITIIGGDLFRRVAAQAKLKERDIKSADKVPRTYNQQLFSLDGRLDLEVSFGDKVMNTTLYLKRDAHDQLLLSEGVCRQLGIISYHPLAEPWRGGKKAFLLEKEVKVPQVTVRLVTSLRLLSRTGAIIPVQVENYEQTHQGTMLFQENPWMLEHTGVVIASGIMQPVSRGIAYMVVENHSGYTESLEESTEIGTVCKADVVKSQDILPTQAATAVNRIRTEEN